MIPVIELDCISLRESASVCWMIGVDSQLLNGVDLSLDFHAGMRKRSAGSGASALVGGLATNEITTFWWKQKRKRGSGSGTEILKSASLLITYSKNDWDSEQKLKDDKISGPAPWRT